VARFRAQLAAARAQCAPLAEWMRQRPLLAVEHQSVWSDLLQVCGHLRQHPRPGCYPRELPLSIGTKFIAEHQALLREMLPLVLPAESIRLDAEDFEARFGFKRDEPAIRMRVLDATAVPGGWPPTITDLSMPHGEFIRLGWPAPRVLVVENKYTFLSLPPLPGVLAVWGAGCAAELLAGADWLRSLELWYWGDLDVAGFHILNRLRRSFPQVRSVMMDAATLAEHGSWAITCAPPSVDETDALSAAERAVCADLRHRQLRLEQEKLSHPLAVSRLRAVFASPPGS